MTNFEDQFAFDAEDYRREYAEARESLGRVNIAVLGKSGVGKSTLLNAVFGEEVAATGTGRPVTEGSHLYVHRSGTVGILDTRGWEIGVHTDRILAELRSEVTRRQVLPVAEQIHVIWYCVNSQLARFEPAEEEVVRRLGELGVPVILALTQVSRKAGRNHPESTKLAQHIAHLALPIHRGTPVLLAALAQPDRGFEQHGLKELVDITFEAAPAGVHAALIAAQKVDLPRKHAKAQAIVAAASASAGAAALIPVPAGDAAAIVPIQLGMMAAVSAVYGMDLDQTTMAGVLGTTLATQLGRLAAGNLIKFVPGLGTGAGAAINAAVASSFTWAIGMAWAKICGHLTAGTLDLADSEAIKLQFTREFKDQFQRRSQDPQR